MLPLSTLFCDPVTRAWFAPSRFFLLQDDEADALEIAVGMSMLCTGDKSSKLIYAWTLMDLDGDDKLDGNSLAVFFRSFLRMLISFSIELSTRTPGETKGVATGMARWLSESIVRDYADEEGLVNFDSFAQWYTEGGYKVAPWFELLDLKKWVLA